MLRYRRATLADVPLLAEWNRQLIQDEGHRNRMTLPELQARMRGFLEGEYTAILFEQEGAPAAVPVAYALYRQDADSLYLRHFFVERSHRRQGIGRQAMALLRQEIWPPDTRITVEVLVHNRAAHAFWRAVGFQDYAVTLELLP